MGSSSVKLIEITAPAHLWSVPIFIANYNPYNFRTNWSVDVVSTTRPPDQFTKTPPSSSGKRLNALSSRSFSLYNPASVLSLPYLRANMLMTGSSWKSLRVIVHFCLCINLAMQNLDEFRNFRRDGGLPVLTCSDKFLLPVEATIKMLALMKSILKTFLALGKKSVIVRLGIGQKTLSPLYGIVFLNLLNVRYTWA